MSGPDLKMGLSIANLLLNDKVSKFLFQWSTDESLISDLELQIHTTKVVLNAAETKQLEGNHFVDIWAQKARYAILDAEDLFDTIVTNFEMEKFRSGETPGISTIFKKKLRYKAKDIARSLHPSKKTRDTEMKEMIKKLESITAHVTRLHLDTNDLTRVREDRVSTSFDYDPLNIIGRTDSEKDILEQLNSREGEDDALRVIPIIGMGGIGKTTLASMVYNKFETTKRSDQGFQAKGWVCFSDKFDMINVLKLLFESITRGHLENIVGLESHLTKLKKELEDKRFLIVMDDVWSDVENKWEILRTIFSVGASGSRILVTTREEKVVHIVSNFKISHKLDGLTNDQCWLLLQKHAFQNGESSAFPNLEKIGKDIILKCKGSPLAVKMLGKVLLTKENNEMEWELVLNSKTWNSTSNIIPSLWLSYYHLPPAIKQCFAYLSIFPKDYPMRMKEVILFWMAEGFIKKPRDGNDYEHVAQKTFKHLLSNFFLQEHPRSKGIFVMHDLIHDLAEYMSKDLMVHSADVNKEARRVTYIENQESLFTKKKYTKLEKLRTFLPFRSSGVFRRRHLSLINNMVCNDFMIKCKFLRVLCLKASKISVVPTAVGDMKLLRYLDLSFTQIECLPRSICRLFNMQTLLLMGCSKLKRLPANVSDLVNLRYLDVQGTFDRTMMSFDGFGRMTNLQELLEFNLREGNSKSMKELKDLNNLHGRLEIAALKYIDDVEDVATAKLENKKFLTELVLKWGARDKDIVDTLFDERVLDALQPCKNLKELTVADYGGGRLSDWMVGVFTGLVYLRLTNCFNCKALTSIGDMPFLKDLVLQKLDSLESLDDEFYGDSDNSFKSLETLEILDMLVLKTLSGLKGWKGGFSSLNKIKIKRCQELIGIPFCAPSLSGLEIESCPNLCKLTSIGSLPLLKEVSIHDLSGIETLGDEFYGDTINPFPALQKLTISGMKSLKTWFCPEGDRRGFMCLNELQILDCLELAEIPYCFPCLFKISIASCDNLIKLEVSDFDKGAASSSSTHRIGYSLRVMNITRCPKLLKIPEGFVNILKVDISQCDSLVLGPRLHDLNMLFRDDPPLLPVMQTKQVRAQGKDDSEIGNEMLELKDGDFRLVRLSLNLAELTIRHDFCIQVPDEIYKLKYLIKLHLSKCQSLESIPDVQAPSTLMTLSLDNCEALKNISDGFLTGCRRSLKTFDIIEMPNLMSLPASFSTVESLSVLKIENCPLIKDLSISSDVVLINLDSLFIAKCAAFESLPGRFHDFAALKFLTIKDCPSIVIPELGFPDKLVEISLHNCCKMEPISKMKLTRSFSLRSLSLDGFLDVTLDKCLPDQIEALTILNFPRLKSLSNVLPTLWCLQYFHVDCCPLLDQSRLTRLKCLPQQLMSCTQMDSSH